MNKSWTQHRANKDKECMEILCNNKIKKGEYYWKKYGRPIPFCQVCARKKMDYNKKMWEERQKNVHKTTPEELAEKVLSMCEQKDIHPHQLMLALQNRMDLT